MLHGKKTPSGQSFQSRRRQNVEHRWNKHAYGGSMTRFRIAFWLVAVGAKLNAERAEREVKMTSRGRGPACTSWATDTSLCNRVSSPMTKKDHENSPSFQSIYGRCIARERFALFRSESDCGGTSCYPSRHWLHLCLRRLQELIGRRSKAMSLVSTWLSSRTLHDCRQRGEFCSSVIANGNPSKHVPDDSW